MSYFITSMLMDRVRQYIKRVSEWRARENEPLIEDIIDVRNGIFLWDSLHRVNDGGAMGVLRVGV
jgi:hypothetical protein